MITNEELLSYFTALKGKFIKSWDRIEESVRKEVKENLPVDEIDELQMKIVILGIIGAMACIVGLWAISENTTLGIIIGTFDIFIGFFVLLQSRTLRGEKR